MSEEYEDMVDGNVYPSTVACSHCPHFTLHTVKSHIECTGNTTKLIEEPCDPYYGCIVGGGYRRLPDDVGSVYLDCPFIKNAVINTSASTNETVKGDRYFGYRAMGDWFDETGALKGTATLKDIQEHNTRKEQ